jgi:ABC-type Mn2+/Zn2+ transport system ATPase subunit
VIAPGTLLRLADVALAYGERPVLAHVSLEVRAGEYWFLLGRNGAGKTTLLRAVLGLLETRAGTLWRDPERAARERTGFVPQRCDFNASLPTTVREFVRLGLVGNGTPRAERTRRVHDALGEVGMAEHIDRDYWTLSGGQRQRLLIARALCRAPSLLVLDEPMNGLDLAAEERLLAFLAELNRGNGLTMLYVTHRIAVARRYATHVAVFQPGGVVVAGPRDVVLTHANVRRAFDLEDADAAAALADGVGSDAASGGGRA